MDTLELDICKKSDTFHVAIVDDEPGMRTMLTRLFESGGMSSRAYASAEGLLNEAGNMNFGCLVVDIGLTGISGLELQAELRRRSSDVSTVIISGQATVADTIRAFKDKASAFFEKPFQNRDLLATVQQLAAEWAMKQTKRQAIATRLKSLTGRELQVMDALKEGKKTIQIAHELNISPSTVEKHRLKIFEKTGVDSVVELIRLTNI